MSDEDVTVSEDTGDDTEDSTVESEETEESE